MNTSRLVKVEAEIEEIALNLSLSLNLISHTVASVSAASQRHS